MMGLAMPVHSVMALLAYRLAKLSELLIHRLGCPKCVVSGTSGCSDIFVSLKELPNEK